MEPKETVYEIEKLADLKKARGEATEDIVFDNHGNMVHNNRAFRRNLKRLWRAVDEGRKSIHWYTKKHNQTNRKTKKQERQNRKKGRQ